MLAQDPVERPVLVAEHARQSGAAALVRLTSSGTPRSRAQAVRGLGRLEDSTHRGVIAQVARAPEAVVRAAAFGALAQLRAQHDYAGALTTERDASVRAVIYEALGRAMPVSGDAEPTLVRGLSDAGAVARTGAARGLESLFRANRRTLKPSTATVSALRSAFAANTGAELRVIVMLTLNAADGTDSVTRALALRDTSAQVRRLGVMAARRWVDDPAPIVRTEAAKFVTDCSQLTILAGDRNSHVALEAISQLGRRRCPAAALDRIASGGRDWQARTAAREALMLVDSSLMQATAPALSRDSIWQVRVRAAGPARLARDTATLAMLARDVNPNVALEALRTPADLERALQSDHAGLLRSAALSLQNSPNLPALLSQVIAAFNRLTADGSMTMRDPRVLLLTRMGETADASTDAVLRDALSDRDPTVAALAAKILSTRTGTTVVPRTTLLPVPPIASASYIAALTGAQARITMRGRGTMTVQLLPDEAPVTVGVFAQLAEAGQYNGLTFHRIVPNFVIQGGSPGADEYDGRTRDFMRDEVGMARNTRGTIGISTRGRDTGDGQIYFNLVDNVRLNRDYTVLAKMVTGFDVMDSIQEGDVIERVEIIRRPSPRR
jgi:cyclophilin family peptidyl-prolyl cis-trans isomerase